MNVMVPASVAGTTERTAFETLSTSRACIGFSYPGNNVICVVGMMIPLIMYIGYEAVLYTIAKNTCVDVSIKTNTLMAHGQAVMQSIVLPQNHQPSRSVSHCQISSRSCGYPIHRALHPQLPKGWVGCGLVG